MADSPAAPAQTFRTFVTGPCNALAYNAALTVARAPGTVYSPLCLCGGPGLGKTHLIHAIAAYLRPRLGGAEILVLHADAFAQSFMAHLGRGNMVAFRRRHRRAGALLIDGLATIGAHPAAAYELAQTLMALREANRQIVIADERRPSAMYGLPAPLARLLACCPTATLGAPDEATRLAIARQTAAVWDVAVPDEALAALAARLRGSVRDVHEALARLAAAAAHGGATPALALQVASEMNRTARRSCAPARVEAVLMATCAYYGVPRQILLGKSRVMTVAEARQVAMYLLREETGLTATQVGQELGRDHSTVLHGHARIAGAVRRGDARITTVLDHIRQGLLHARAAAC
jgi:chromosomal replication initiator protein